MMGHFFLHPYNTENIVISKLECITYKCYIEAMEKDKHISLRINQTLHQNIKRKAEREGMSFSEALRFAIRKWTESKSNTMGNDVARGGTVELDGEHIGTIITGAYQFLDRVPEITTQHSRDNVSGEDHVKVTVENFKRGDRWDLYMAYQGEPYKIVMSNIESKSIRFYPETEDCIRVKAGFGSAKSKPQYII